MDNDKNVKLSVVNQWQINRAKKPAPLKPIYPFSVIHLSEKCNDTS